MTKCEFIINLVCKNYDISFDRLKEKNRQRFLCVPRQIIMTALHLNTQMSYSSIGALFYLDHATVIHATKTISESYEYKDYLISLNKAIKTRSDLTKGHPPIYNEYINNFLNKRINPKCLNKNNIKPVKGRLQKLPEEKTYVQPKKSPFKKESFVNSQIMNKFIYNAF